MARLPGVVTGGPLDLGSETGAMAAAFKSAFAACERRQIRARARDRRGGDSTALDIRHNDKGRGGCFLRGRVFSPSIRITLRTRPPSPARSPASAPGRSRCTSITSAEVRYGRAARTSQAPADRSPWVKYRYGDAAPDPRAGGEEREVQEPRLHVAAPQERLGHRPLVRRTGSRAGPARAGPRGPGRSPR